MALISPILDDRSFAQLKDELVRRIPVYTQEWTDHNETDPGIALLELFAYLGESVLYRFNQIPETTKIEFLRLLGVQARPARPATAVIAGTTELAAGVQIPLSTAVTAGKVPFRTSGETYVWPLDCLAVGKVAAPVLPEPPAGDVIAISRYRAEKARRSDALARAGLTPQQAAAFYVTTQLAADPNDPDAAPLDVSTTLDQLLWIAVLRKKTTDLALLRDQSLFVGLAFDEAVDRPFDLLRLGPGQTRAFRSDGLTAAPPPMVWRLWNGPGRDGTTLAVGSDTTRGLVTTGVVELLLPHQLPDLATLPPGTGDETSPPPLADEKQAAAVVAWISVGRPKADHLNDAIHKVRWVGLNAAPVVQSRVAGPELLGTGTGDAGQRYPLAQLRRKARHPRTGRRCCRARPCSRSRNPTAGTPGRRWTASSSAAPPTGTTRSTTPAARSSSVTSGCRNWASGSGLSATNTARAPRATSRPARSRASPTSAGRRWLTRCPRPEGWTPRA